MTKARDNASLSSTLSTAEVAYLDGVTSSVQTQLDAKIAKTLTSTTGDIIYASSANTPARLGIGSTDQVLKVSGGVPTWATPSATAQSFSLIGTAALTGAATITVSGISGKNQLMILVINGSSASASSYLQVRFNADSATNYTHAGQEFIAAAAYSVNNQTATGADLETEIQTGQMSGAVGGYFDAGMMVYGCNSSGIKVYQSMGGGTPSASNGQRSFSYTGKYIGTSTISSVSVISSSGNFDAGDVYVYGSA